MIRKVNESIRSLMKPKSEEDILKQLDDMSYRKANLLFIKAISLGYTNIVKKLIDKGVSINYNQGRPLITAVKHNRTDITKILLDKGVKTDYDQIEDYLDDYENDSYDLVTNHRKINESQILRFNDMKNLEFRKGSLEHGDKVKQLIEFLRIYKDQNEDTMVFNKNDFEKASKMKISDIEQINNISTKKSLFDFDIEITDKQIKFTNLQNRKSIHKESLKILNLSDFYKKLENN
jgi:hypothetical protein